MKKIVSVITAVVVLLSASGIVGCVPPGISQGKYNKAVSDLEAAEKRIETLESRVETLEGKMEEAGKYAEFTAYFLGGPMEAEAAEKYYAKMPEKLMALGDMEVMAKFKEMGEKIEGMKAKGATEKEIMMAMWGLGKRLSVFLIDKIAKALE